MLVLVDPSGGRGDDGIDDLSSHFAGGAALIFVAHFGFNLHEVVVAP